jgi:TRAP transporter TAXI family solute receptor
MKITTKSVIGTIAVASSLFIGGLMPNNQASAQRFFFGIATGGTGGVYYPLGGMLAQIISNKATINGQKFSATAESSGASVANAALLGNKEIESAFVAADILEAAYTGTNQFKGKQIGNLRSIGALYPETVQLVVRANSPINAITDLKGKSISSGAPGSGQYQLLTDLLIVNGMTRDDVKEDSSSFSQAADKIKDNNLDATLINAGLPTSAITDLALGTDIKILPLTGPKIAELQKKQPFYAKAILPANTYKGVTKDVETIAVRTVWTTHADVPEQVIYEVTKALFENLETMAKVHAQGANITLKTALDIGTTPLHPGAIKYYKEKGLIK